MGYATTSTHGFLWAFPGGTETFLRADATYAALYGYSPGSFTVATENAKVLCNHLKLTSSQRATLAGTARLRIT
jgi:hypothetical protein